MRINRPLLVLLVWLVTRASLPAQTTGSVSVTDTSGGALPGATVTLTERESGRRVVSVTDGEGSVALDGIAPGTYRLEVYLPGFAPAVVPTLTLPAMDSQTVRLEPATLNEAVTVTATRVPSPLSQIPMAVSVVDRETLTRELSVADNLTEVLSKTVPGLGPSRETEAIFGQALRGRDMLVLVDGVPQNFELRIGATDELSRVTPSFLERVEVVRGASAAYGASAAGGIVHLITQAPQRTRIDGTAGLTVSAAYLAGSADRRLMLGGGGARRNVSWFGSGAYQGSGGDFDADGRRIPQLFLDSNTNTFDFLGRATYAIASNQQVTVGGLFRDARLRQAYAPSGGLLGVTQASAVRVPLGYGTPDDRPVGPVETPFKREAQGQVRYRHSDLVGSAVSVQGYWLAYQRRNTHTDFFGGQLEPEFSKAGIRVDVESSLHALRLGSLHWGLDAGRYSHIEPISGGVTFVPKMQQFNVAPFAQVTLPLGTRGTARGGLRYERFGVRVPDFTTHPVYGGNAVAGGDLTYAAVTGNAGMTWSLSRALDVYGGFSQGFSITEVGRLLRNTRLPSVTAARPDAQRVNSVDVGLRATVRRTTLAGSIYRSWSELGTTFAIFPSTGLPYIIRAPERIFGGEVAADVVLPAGWRAGSQASFQAGEYDPANSGVYTPLPGFRIAPPMISSYVGVRRGPWDTQGRVSWSGARNAFPGSTNYGEGRVRPVTIVDLNIQRSLGGGHLALGVRNLLNRLYVPAPNQAFNSDFLYIAGTGTNVSLTYRVSLVP